jgi:beta-lactamase class D
MSFIRIDPLPARILPESRFTLGCNNHPAERAMDRFVSPLLVLFTSLSAAASDTVARPQWQREFDAKGVRGTFVLFEPASDRYLVFNEARARQRFLPASTFKIPNALIGLEVGSITDENEVFHWDGKPKPRAAWERDHTLGTGMRESVVWMFQEVARRTGKERMKDWLDRLGYGNRDLTGGIDLFWLQGGLRVSAVEQVEFLRKLAEGELPMTQRSQRLVKNALAVEKKRDYTLYAKTGSSGAMKNPVSWWVGWVERKGKPAAFFAMNFTPAPRTRYEDRFAIARAILAEAGALPSESPPS